MNIIKTDSTPRPGCTLRPHLPRLLKRVCILCDQELFAHSILVRYCENCRIENILCASN